MSSVQLSIIIVNWNSADYVLACLRSLQYETKELSYEVIVVDNASFDHCRERLAAEFPDVLFLQSERNLGFARANNWAATSSRGPVLLFLNPDTEVKDRGVERLYGELHRVANPGVVGCRLLNTDGSVQTSCIQAFPTVLNQFFDVELLQRWFPKAGLWGAAALFGNDKEASEVEGVSGACMMVRREAFERVGGFSSDYFMYGEDMDLCFKMRRAQMRNYFVPQVVIIHHGGGSSQQARSEFSHVMMRESVALFLRKFRGAAYSWLYRRSLSAAASGRLVLLLCSAPLWLMRNRKRAWRVACRKWLSILQWSLGLKRPQIPAV